MKKSKNCFGLVLCGMFLVTQLSCSNSPTSPPTVTTSPPTSGTIKISIKGVSTGTPVSLGKVIGKTAALATITSAWVVIDEVEFESSLGDTMDYEFEQPFVQDLMAGVNIHEIEYIQVPYGSYKELEIEIDELKPEDGAVYTQNPELQDRSIVVKGYLNNDPNQTFIYTSDLDEEQEREFDPPLILDENTPSTNLVLALNMDTWFVDANGNFLDPETDKDKIEDNIKASLEVFEDKDDDGEEDD